MTNNKKFLEIKSKIFKIREIIAKENLSGILVNQQYNISWLTAGAANHVLWDDQNSLIGILITEDKEIIFSENGDFNRIQDEEFLNYPFEYKKFEWYSSNFMSEALKVTGGRIGTDFHAPGIDDHININGTLSELRSVLTEIEVKRLKLNGKKASELLTNVCSCTKSGIRESEIASMLCEEYVKNGFSISVILIGGDERSLKYRHQVVTDYRIKKHFSFVGVGRKEGLAFPINRVVSFGKPSAELVDNNKKIETVYVYLNSMARIGVNLNEIYRSLPDIYRMSEIDKDEWRNHTQGGTMGYLPREAVLCEGCDYILRENNVIGWNPSLPGVMAEDVYLLKKNDLEYITHDKKWPSQKIVVEGIEEIRPAIMVL